MLTHKVKLINSALSLSKSLFILLIFIQTTATSQAQLEQFVTPTSPIFTRQFSPIELNESLKAFGLIRPFDWNPKKKEFEKKFFALSYLNLDGSGFFQNESFSFYKSTSHIPIALNIKEEKTINVFYNLQKAKAYFTELGRVTKTPLKLDPIKVRIDIPYNFSSINHFDKKDSEFNTARTIPPYDPNKVPPELMQVLPWSTEIWFSPKWEIPVATKYVPMRVIEAAMCPDVVYHEFTHAVTGKYLGNNSVGRTLNEGLSDYFAATLINHTELYTFKTCQGKPFQIFEGGFRFKNPGIYHRAIEADFTENFKLVPGLLWKIRKLLGAGLTDMIVYNAITLSGPNSLIFPDFFENIHRSLIKFLGAEAALPIIRVIEDSILMPHKIFTSFSIEQTYFKYLPKTNMTLVNEDARFYAQLQKELPGFCTKRNEFKFNFAQFNLTYRYFPVIWHCDDFKIPLGVDYFYYDPEEFIPVKDDGNRLMGSLRLLKPKPSTDNPQLKALWKFVKTYLLADFAFKSMSIRPSKNEANLMLIQSENSPSYLSYFKFSAPLK